MASSKSRRFSRGRKFLYEQEVDQILQEEEENSRKTLITSFPIADDLKLKISKESNLVVVLKELEEYSKGVCSITVISPDSSSRHVGSGFYIGDGWVLTTANVVRNRDQVRNATFAFSSTEGTATYQARDRRAFVHRMLPPGRRPDYHNRDLTLIKLGVQFTRRRRKEDIAEWENEEQALLASHKPFNFQNLITDKQGLISATETKPLEGDILCTVYHGLGNAEDPNQKRFQFGFNVSRAYQVLDLEMLEFSGGFDGAVSGCPFLAFRNGQFYFLGVFLAGSSYKAGTGNVLTYTGQALLWQGELAGHVRFGTKAVDKMSKIVPYTLDIPFDERAKLLMDKTVYEAAELALDHRVLIL